MKNFRTYQLAMELYKQGQTVKIVSAHLKDQFDRASLSVVLNLAEGEGKITLKDRKKFYTIAMGSLREVQACLDIIEHKDLQAKASKIGGMLYNLIKNTYTPTQPQPRNPPRDS